MAGTALATPTTLPPQGRAALAVIGHTLREWWYYWVPLTVLSLVWLVSWLTLVLGPPATLGLLAAVRAILQGETPSLSAWWQGVRRYAGRAWLWALLNLLLLWLLGTNLWFYAHWETPLAAAMRWLFGLVGVLWALIQFYALPFLLEQERPQLGIALRNGFYTLMAAPFYTLLIQGFAGLLILGSTLVMAPWFLGLPALLALLSHSAVVERLTVYGLRPAPLAWSAQQSAGKSESQV